MQRIADVAGGCAQHTLCPDRRLVRNAHECKHQYARDGKRHRCDHYDGCQAKESEHHATDYRPANTRNHAHLVCDGRGLRDALGGDHER